MRNEKNRMKDLKQRMEVAVSTFYKINGVMPDREELYGWLGDEFAPVLSSYGVATLIAS